MLKFVLLIYDTNECIKTTLDFRNSKLGKYFLKSSSCIINVSIHILVFNNIGKATSTWDIKYLIQFYKLYDYKNNIYTWSEKIITIIW